MKIHVLITSLETGGAQAALPRIVKVMRDAGHVVEVTVCEPRDLGAAPLLDAAGIRYTVLHPEHRSKLARIAAFTQVVRQSRPDVIVTLLSSAGLVGAVTGWLLGVPVVAWKNCANRRLHTWCLRGMTRLWIADSSSVATLLTTRMGIAGARVMTWPLFEQTTFHTWPHAWDGHEPLQIGSVGRLHRQKGYDLLIDAIARLLQAHPELRGRFHVTLLGEGPQRKLLEASIVRLGLEQVFSLPGASDDVRPFLASLHLYLQPSRFEGMCLAAHEAMSAGLPIIASPVGELAESVRASGGGQLLGRDTVASLAESLATLLHDPGKLPTLGQAGKAYIERIYDSAAFATAGQSVLRRIEALAEPSQRPVRATVR